MRTIKVIRENAEQKNVEARSYIEEFHKNVALGKYVKLEKSPQIFPQCDIILKKISWFSLELDRSHTKPQGWMRFINRHNCRKRVYINYNNQPLIHGKSSSFEFSLDQNDDIWLESTNALYCVCDLGEKLVVAKVKNSGRSFINLTVQNAVPALAGHGDSGGLLSYFHVEK